MSFLKSLGQALNVTSAFVPATAPLVALLAPKAGPVFQTVQDATNMMNVIIQVEQMGQTVGLTGQQMLTMATPQIAQLLATTPLLMGRKVNDPVKYADDVRKLTGALADVLNDFEAVPVPK